jgi:cardiolipin synthase A/B
VLERRHRPHRVDRLRNLRYHHKLLFSLLIVFAVLAVLLTLAKDQQTLKIVSEYAASDARYPEYVAALVGAQPTAGNSYQVLPNGDAFIPAMLEAIDHARRRVSLETYNYEKGELSKQFTAALEAAARRGVLVNLVIDAVGSKKMPRDQWQRLKDAGARVADYGTPRWYKLHTMNYRDHRKILVVDGRIAFTGGAGVADHWMGHAQDPDHWRDTMIRIEGPLVRLLEAAFNEDFIEALAPAEPVLDAPGPEPHPTPSDTAFLVRGTAGSSNDLKRLYMLAIASARKTLDICSPYLVTDASSEWALSEAVKRGVHIRMLVEGDHTDALVVKYAGRAAYDHFLAQGIEVYEYQPTMMHAKTMIVDGVWSMFGSANFDNRSLELNDEINVAVTDRRLAAQLTGDFEHDLQSAKKLELHEWRRRSLLERAREEVWKWFDEMF